MSSNLDSYVTSSRPPPEPVATSQEIRDRSSTFVAYLFEASSPELARACISHLRNVIHGSKPASHEISAWRCMTLRKGSTGLNGPEDFEVTSEFLDDGEKWASVKIKEVMESFGVIDACVVVSRWYGGTMLGPVRFEHIKTCAADVCRTFKREEELRECRVSLASLDSILSSLRAELTLKKPDDSRKPQRKPQDPSKVPDYTDIDVPKARRLILARENAIKSVKKVLEKYRRAPTIE